MADSPLNDLNYGRPGLTTYDLDTRGWNTSRGPTTSVLQQVSEWQLALPAATTSISTDTLKNATTSRKDARRLAHDHPQLVPAAKDLPDLSTLSQAVTSAAMTYDPHIGDLLAFGTVFLNKSFRPKQIAALPTGPSRSILRLVPLGQQRNGWEGDRSVWLQGPSFTFVDSGYWNEEAAPIQQVIFGQTETSNSLLAVRLPSKTVLFRPSYHRGRRAAEPSPYYHLPPSLLSAQPIISITIAQTGGVPHADFDFNPNYQFQFGIVDEQGAWSLWQIARRAKRDEYSVSRLVGGHISPAEEEVADSEDGWARILWAGDSNTLLVCSRRQLSLVNVTGETFEYLPAPPVISQRSSEWILDLKRHPQQQECFFILTSTRLFLMSVTTSSSAADSSSGQAGATILLSRRHYRGDEDLTLQMHPQIFEEQTALFVKSRLNKLVQLYYFQDRSSSQAECISTTDPVSVDLDLPGAAYIMQMHLQPLEYGSKEALPHKRLNTSAQLYHERAIPFHQLTVLTADLGVHQIVLLSAKHDPAPERLAWRKMMAPHSLDARSDVDEMDGFIEPNGPNWEIEPGPKLRAQVPRLLSDRDLTHATADRTELYESLLHSEQAGSTSIEDVIQQLQETMGVQALKFETNVMETLDTIDVPDIDEASAKVQQLFESQSINVLRPIASQQVLRLPGAEQTSITNLYDTVLKDWVAPLTAQIPVSVRQAKERLARRVATEVILASTQLRPSEEEQSIPSSSGPASLPVLPSESLDAISSSLPTPPQSSIPPSSPLFPESSRPRRGDPLSRLRKHLVIDDVSNTTLIGLPPSVSDLLLHWQPGNDPSTYNWESTERAIRPEVADEETQELLEKERKKRERRDKRQRREDELLRAKTQTSRQPLFSQPVFPRSSPGPFVGGMTASSQVPVPTSSQMPIQIYDQGGGFGGLGGFGGMSGMVPQSQVEPGKFGGRPDKKKKKSKSRVSGF
ncbi:uncharacterized protein M421DRAFT_424930 [Didymella exigua CBS 183.55]|uniref:RNA polymerase I-specific transcription initiation factor RRN6-like protein n=1 Tax=Didymella exigua CBS 183.55 TaxID=1150837 RepID=A0A6A5R7X9_9PLEO|nr:uncharacterized protein M421DRAFT_424930 [Didymella exigua CBS 183.55]KAF1924291.1 hypothetical protein M421DRAFT_424930 [Didymella exigua CBS 183.55]